MSTTIKLISGKMLAIYRGKYAWYENAKTLWISKTSEAISEYSASIINMNF